MHAEHWSVPFARREPMAFPIETKGVAVRHEKKEDEDEVKSQASPAKLKQYQ